MKSPMPRLRINSEDINDRDNGPPCINVDSSHTTNSLQMKSNDNNNTNNNNNNNNNPFFTPRNATNNHSAAIAALIAQSDPNDVSVL
jgi:hypothetical protein